MMGPTMNLISGTHHSCERKEHAFMVLREYTIISQKQNGLVVLIILLSNLITVKSTIVLNELSQGNHGSTSI